jgi:hypothetical protein
MFLMVKQNDVLSTNSRFEVNQAHILERLGLRYPDSEEPRSLVKRVMAVLEKNTPNDWRFTESPTSRFFIFDECSGAKFMGLSFRYSKELQQIINALQHEDLKDARAIWISLEEYAAIYRQQVLRPDLKIIHDLRTVYPSRKGSIGEEMRVFERIRKEIMHMVPIGARKIGSRPNAIISEENELWVRQYMNWLGSGSGGTEYYLFHPLTTEGTIRSRYRVWSLTDQGHLKREFDGSVACDETCKIISQCKKQIRPGQNIRSESYWKVPTNLDRRWIDLDFRKRMSHKNAASSTGNPLNGRELSELFFLEQILESARSKLNTK